MSFDVVQILIVLAVLVPSVILHEVSHGAVALAFGDDTAKRAGRLTLNPLPHIDPFGTVLLPLLLAVAGTSVFGYAKPVPVNHGNLRRPRDHGLVVSLAGPAVNIVLAIVAALLLRTFAGDGVLAGGETALRLLFSFGVINVVLAAFNLIPVPPLDGSAVIERFLPRRWLGRWWQLRRYSMGILLLLVLLLPDVLGAVFEVAVRFWARFL